MSNKMVLLHAANALVLFVFAYFLFDGASNIKSLNVLIEWRGVLYISLLLSVFAFWYSNRKQRDGSDMLPIIKVGNGMLYLSKDKSWYLKFYEKEYEVLDEEHIIALLPLFETDYEQFKRTLEENNISQDMLARLPLQSAMKYPFDHQRTTWMDTTLTWIEKSGMAGEMRDWALTIKRDTMPQAIMHRFRNVFDLPKGWDKPENP